MDYEHIKLELKELKQRHAELEDKLAKVKMVKWPVEEQEVWLNDANGPGSYFFEGDKFDKRLLKSGQLFRTREQLKTYNQIVDRIIKLDEGWEPDWSDFLDAGKFYLFYNYDRNEVSYCANQFLYKQGTIYMQKSTAETLFKDFTQDELKIFVGVGIWD